MRKTLIGASAALLMFALPAAADEILPDPTAGNVYVSANHRDYEVGYSYHCSGWFRRRCYSYSYTYLRSQASDSDGADPIESGAYVADSGRSRSSTVFSLDPNTGQARFDFDQDVAAATGNTYRDSALAASSGRLFFDVQDGYTAEYQLAGLYSGVLGGDSNDSFRAITQIVRVDSETGDETIVDDYDHSATSGTFSLEGQDPTGDPTGVLGAGRYYLNFSRQVYVNGYGSGSADGFLTLNVNETAINAVPEPGTYALLGLAGLMLCLRRRT